MEKQATLPHRRYGLHKMVELHAQHLAENPMYDHEAVRANVPVTITHPIGEKTSSATHAFWHKLMHSRIPGTQWTTGNMLFCIL
jgi:hypothetical protein